MTFLQRPLLPAIVLLTALVGCATGPRQPTVTAATEPDPAEGWACLAFRPITWSSRDTSETAQQVMAHNAVWDAVCRQD